MTTINLNGGLFNRLFGLCVAMFELWWLERNSDVYLCYACEILHSVYVKIGLMNIFVDCVVYNRLDFAVAFCFPLYLCARLDIVKKFKNKINRRVYLV